MGDKQQTQLYNNNLIKFCDILRLSTEFVDQQIGVLNMLVHAHGHVLTTFGYAAEMCAGKAALSELYF